MSIVEAELGPSTEARTHIRLAPTSRSALGRLLANEAYTPFEVVRHGRFASLEAYWAYVRSGFREFEARELYGEHALRATMRSTRRTQRNFHALILMGLECKIEQTKELATLLANNTLELVRYDMIEDEPVLNPDQPWFMEHLNKTAKRLKCRKQT